MDPDDYGVSETTSGIRVSVRTQFLSEQSEPRAGRFVWAYRVLVENLSTRTVQLRARTWRIVDANGSSHQVHGPGVVGEEPVLKPGERFEYTSGTPLGTPSGMMHGTYHMTEPETGAAFDVAVPAFSLDSPSAARTLH